MDHLLSSIERNRYFSEDSKKVIDPVPYDGMDNVPIRIVPGKRVRTDESIGIETEMVPTTKNIVN